MGILIALMSALIGAALLAGCYDPELVDCTVSCVGPDDCPAGQVCGDDRFCAAPSVAGTCEDLPPPDPATLTIRVERRGRVEIVDPAFACTAGGDGGAICTTVVPRTGTLELHAVMIDHPFEQWTTAACGGQPATCELEMGPAEITVGVRFN